MVIVSVRWVTCYHGNHKKVCGCQKEKNEWSLVRFALRLINLVRVVVLINSSISVEIIIQLF